MTSTVDKTLHRSPFHRDDCRYAYSRLKWLGNKLLSFAVTMVFVSLWHGLWPGYFLCFFHELMCVQAERDVSHLNFLSSEP